MAPIEASYLVGLISYVNRLLLHSEIVYNNGLLTNLAVILVVPVLWKQVFAPDTVLPPLPGWVGAECEGKMIAPQFWDQCCVQLHTFWVSHRAPQHN